MSFADEGKNIYDVIISKGFTEKTNFLVGTISKNNVGKNINQDVVVLLDITKRINLGKEVQDNPEYVIWLANGSSFDSQTITIAVSKTGNGYVQYMKRNIAFFNSIDLYNFCVTTFDKSTIVVH